VPDSLPAAAVHTRKVKMPKKPKFDLINTLLEIHGDTGAAPVSTGEDKGETVKVADLGEVQEQGAGAGCRSRRRSSAPKPA